MMDVDVDPTNLVALHVLIEERHVTRAARRLGITQSSMSHRLRSLRASLRDPLFVRGKHGLVLTPRAQRIAQPLALALRDLRAATRPSVEFSPMQDRYQLTLAIPDLLMPLVPELTRALSKAPGVQIQLRPMPSSLAESLHDGSLQLALAPLAHAQPSIMSRSLGHLRFGVVVRERHPLTRHPITLARWLSYEHVVVSVGNASPNVIDEALSRRGRERRIRLEVPSFLAGLCVVARSDAVMNAPTPLVDEVSHALRLEVHKLPLAIPPVPFAMLWDQRYAAEPGHRWCRDIVYATVRARLHGG